MLLPFWDTSLVVWRVFLLPPWSKESLHGENDSSNLSMTCTDSVPFPELWSRHDLLLLLPQVFVTLKDIIFLMKDKNVTAFKILKGRHTFWIKLIFQINVSKFFFFFKYYLFRNLYGRYSSMWYLQSLQSSNRQGFFTEWKENKAKKREKKIKIHYLDKKTVKLVAILDLRRSPFFFGERNLILHLSFQLTSYRRVYFLWLDPLFTVLNWEL